MSLLTVRALLLRAHPYSETSLVLRFLTDRRGIVGVMARGARRSGARGSSGLATFAGGSLTFYMKETRDLQTFKEFDVDRARRGLGVDPVRLAAASVLAEIVLRHAGEADTGHLFQVTSDALDALEQAERAALVGVLLKEGWGLVSVLGFHPAFETCLDCGRALDDEEMARVDFGQGGLRCASCAGGSTATRVGPGARAQLAGLLAGSVPDPLTRPRAHLQLLSDFVTYHLAGSRPLETFRILAALLPMDDA